MPRILPSAAFNNGSLVANWLVPDMLCKGSMVILAGDAGVGKSMLSYSLAAALASGTVFLGHKLAADRVLYFDEENSLADSHAYLKRVWLGLGSPDPQTLDANLFLHHFSLTQNYATDMIRLVSEIKPALIIIDTANAALRLEDENDNAQATKAIHILREVKKGSGREDCTMLILKHAKVTHDRLGNEYRDIRGAKTWKGELDGVIVHTAPRGRPPGHGRYRNTFLWPTKSRAFGLLQALEIMPVCSGDSVRFTAKIPD